MASVRTCAIALLLLILAGCDRRPDDVPVVVSVIDPAGAATAPGSATARVIDAATAQGLVRFDAAGGIEPGLAERWIVIDDGGSIIFRLREAEWSDGTAVTAEQVMPALRRRLAAAGRNPLRPYLTAIDQIVAMTPQVIEVRLSRPRPDLLKLFAQPELAIAAPRGGGSGPFRVQRDAGTGVLLRPAFDPSRTLEDDVEEPSPQEFVRVRGERAAAAVARFAARRSDLVDGGTIADWPLLAHADIAPNNVRHDAAAGLFGLAIARRAGFLADRRNRAAVAMAIDRAALTRGVHDGWRPIETVLPAQLDSATRPSPAAWAGIAAADRVAAARARVTRYGRRVRLAIALPEGPGGTMLYGGIAASLRRIGIDAARATPDGDADLRLVDAVAPYDSARWYLRVACQPCAAAAATLIEAARDAPTLRARADRIAEADAALAADVAFVPIAPPLRWSLVATRLRAWTPNPRAFHPLNELRAAPN